MRRNIAILILIIFPLCLSAQIGIGIQPAYNIVLYGDDLSWDYSSGGFGFLLQFNYYYNMESSFGLESGYLPMASWDTPILRKGNTYSIPLMLFYQKEYPKLFEGKFIPKIKISLGVHNYIMIGDFDSSNSLNVAIGFGVGCTYELTDKIFIDGNLNLIGTSGLVAFTFYSVIDIFLVPSIGLYYKF